MPAVLQAWATEGEIARLLAVAWLLVARLLPLVLLVPAFGVRGAPAAWLATASVALAAALMPTALASAPVLPADVLGLTVLSARELCLGAVYAFALALPFWALGWGGRLSDTWRGALPDFRGPSPLSELYLWVGVVAFLALGGHRMVIAALAEGLATHPLGAVTSGGNFAALALSSARLAADALAAALMVAAPAAAALFLFDVALGVVVRAAPAFPGLAVAVPVRAAIVLAVALIGSALLLGGLPRAFDDALTAARRLFEAAP
jgi:type III secretory pathway component EscT